MNGTAGDQNHPCPQFLYYIMLFYLTGTLNQLMPKTSDLLFPVIDPRNAR